MNQLVGSIIRECLTWVRSPPFDRNQRVISPLYLCVCIYPPISVDRFSTGVLFTIPISSRIQIRFREITSHFHSSCALLVAACFNSLLSFFQPAECSLQRKHGHGYSPMWRRVISFIRFRAWSVELFDYKTHQ